MRCEVLGPGHVRFRPRRGVLTFLLGAVLVGLVAMTLLWPEGQERVLRWSLFALGALVALTIGIARRCGTVVEIDREGVLWRTRWPQQIYAIRTKRSAVGAIRIRPQLACMGSAGQPPRSTFVVELRPEGQDLPGTLVLWRGRSERRARRVAEWIARAAVLPCEDAIGDQVASWLPGMPAVQTPRTKVDRSAPPPSVIVDHSDVRGAVVWVRGFVPMMRRTLLGLAMVASVPLAVVGAVTAAGFPVDALRHLAWGAIGLAEALVLLGGMFLLRGRTRIVVTDGQLQVERWCLGMRVGQRALLQSEVMQVRVQTNLHGLPQFTPGVVVFATSDSLLLGQGLDEGGIRWLGAWLEDTLWPPTAAVTESAGAQGRDRRRS